MDTSNTTTSTTASSAATGASSTIDGIENSGLPTENSTNTSMLLAALAIGSAVSLAAGTYAKLHTPTGDAIATFGFPAVLPMKAWFATAAGSLAIFQIASALWMWGRLPGVARPAPTWVSHGHRWFGTAAFLFTLPVAYHCLWALGFQDTSMRVLAHSLLGCAFYGVFTTKMLLLRSDRVPPRSLPIAGGLLATILVAIWWTSSFWFFTNIGFPV